MEETKYPKDCERCGKLGIAIIRTKTVCKDCFNIFKSDNRARINANLSIPGKLVTLNNER